MCITLPFLYSSLGLCSQTQDKAEKNALKQKLRRLCEDKSRGNGNAPRLQVPDWVHEQWKTRDHLEMALEYQATGFQKDRLGFFGGGFL